MEKICPVNSGVPVTGQRLFCEGIVLFNYGLQQFDVAFLKQLKAKLQLSTIWHCSNLLHSCPHSTVMSEGKVKI